MRILVVLAISLSFSVPALAQNALWGTSGNSTSSGQNPTGMPAGQAYGQGTSVGPGYGPSGPGTPGANPAAAPGKKRRHSKTQTQLKEADAERAKMSGVSTMKSYDDNASAKSSQAAQQAAQSAITGSAQQAPASAAPAQAAPTPHKQSGVQTY
ncbi:MAG: hypothetical protein P4L53_24985 [Candidatus Obscuribacterales bacterium]|nr:hypothetical protein [Candidatus Obscuribacterales bacterium]